MRHVLAVLFTGLFVLSMYSISSALDLGLGSITGKAEETKKEATDKAKNMAGKAEEKKNEGKDTNMMGDIKTKGKEMMNQKVDEVQSDVIGK